MATRTFSNPTWSMMFEVTVILKVGKESCIPWCDGEDRGHLPGTDVMKESFT